MEKAAKRRLRGIVFAALFAALTAVGAYIKIPLPFTPVPVTFQTLFVLLSGAMLGSNFGAISMLIYLLLGIAGFPVFAGGSSGFGAILGPTGGYLIGFPVAAYIIGRMGESKKYRFVGYALLALLSLLLVLIYADMIFSLGIIKNPKTAAPLIDELSPASKGTIVIGSFIVFAALISAIYSSTKRNFPFSAIASMAAGSILIYVSGAVHGAIVTGLPFTAVLFGWVFPFIIGDLIKLLIAVYISAVVDVKRHLGE